MHWRRSISSNDSNAMQTHTHTQHHFCPLSNVPNKREKPRTFELSFSHSSSPSAKSYTLPISNASGSSFRFSFSCLSVSRITFRCVFNCSFDCDFPPPFVGSPTPSFFFAFGSRFFRSVPSLFSVTISSSGTSSICFVPGCARAVVESSLFVTGRRLSLMRYYVLSLKQSAKSKSAFQTFRVLNDTRKIQKKEDEEKDTRVFFLDFQQKSPHPPRGVVVRRELCFV